MTLEKTDLPNDRGYKITGSQSEMHALYKSLAGEHLAAGSDAARRAAPLGDETIVSIEMLGTRLRFCYKTMRTNSLRILTLEMGLAVPTIHDEMTFDDIGSRTTDDVVTSYTAGMRGNVQTTGDTAPSMTNRPYVQGDKSRTPIGAARVQMSPPEQDDDAWHACPTCGGSGEAEQGTAVCATCGGDGLNPDRKYKCASCRGRQRVRGTSSPCVACAGVGTYPSPSDDLDLMNSLVSRLFPNGLGTLADSSPVDNRARLLDNLTERRLDYIWQKMVDADGTYKSSFHDPYRTDLDDIAYKMAMLVKP